MSQGYCDDSEAKKKKEMARRLVHIIPYLEIPVFHSVAKVRLIKFNYSKEFEQENVL